MINWKTAATTLVVAASCIGQTVQAVEARGMRSCGTWTKERAVQGVDHFVSEAWLLGYLSGMAFVSSKNILKGTDNDSLYLWMDNYCKANPLKDEADGANDLYFELVRQKRM
ncbi:hypothetical protein QTH97_02310 [Variovorax sp. J22R24]|uniref:hypothetical protein n=1 Tax=Variovorax gracilis TaxID=3053502 RepID=UPI00257697FF|nr:hypothetical protein [Variovorax sp. J22R24]MDM0103750.1 hypothetical protein [Variovorax sp. J22R24]